MNKEAPTAEQTMIITNLACKNSRNSINYSPNKNPQIKYQKGKHKGYSRKNVETFDEKFICFQKEPYCITNNTICDINQ